MAARRGLAEKKTTSPWRRSIKDVSEQKQTVQIIPVSYFHRLQSSSEERHKGLRRKHVFSAAQSDEGNFSSNPNKQKTGLRSPEDCLSHRNIWLKARCVRFSSTDCCSKLKPRLPLSNTFPPITSRNISCPQVCVLNYREFRVINFMFLYCKQFI